MIARDSLRARIEYGLSIYQKAVMMMTVTQLDLDEPGAIRLALHGVSRRIPIIEIAGEMDLSCSGSYADEVDRLGHLLCGVPVGCEERTNLLHRTKTFHSNLL